MSLFEEIQNDNRERKQQEIAKGYVELHERVGEYIKALRAKMAEWETKETEAMALLGEVFEYGNKAELTEEPLNKLCEKFYGPNPCAEVPLVDGDDLRKYISDSYKQQRVRYTK